MPKSKPYVEYYPTKLEEYAEKYKEYIALRREDGILEVRFHTDNGPMQWSPGHQHGWLALCQDIARDMENEVVIITGTGDAFNNYLMPMTDPRSGRADNPRIVFDGEELIDGWYRIVTRMIMQQLSLQIPVISAINGPLNCHPEMVLMSDIILCSENTWFAETHLSGGLACAPGDGTFAIWRTLIGMNRAKYYAYTGKHISAQEALDWGVVHEVLPQDKLNERAWEWARELMKKPRYARNLSHQIMNKPWRDIIANEIEFSMAHESLSCMADLRGGVDSI